MHRDAKRATESRPADSGTHVGVDSGSESGHDSHYGLIELRGLEPELAEADRISEPNSEASPPPEKGSGGVRPGKVAGVTATSAAPSAIADPVPPATAPTATPAQMPELPAWVHVADVLTTWDTDWLVQHTWWDRFPREEFNTATFEQDNAAHAIMKENQGILRYMGGDTWVVPTASRNISSGATWATHLPVGTSKGSMWT